MRLLVLAAGHKLTITVRDPVLLASWESATWSTEEATLSVARSDHTAAVWPPAGHPSSQVYVAGKILCVDLDILCEKEATLGEG